MSEDNTKYKYNELFPDIESKAKAFDEIAIATFAKRFRVESAAEVLFALYYNALVSKNYCDINVCSDIEVAKELGTTRNAIVELKKCIWQRGLFSAPKGWWKKAFINLMKQPTSNGLFIRIMPLDTILREKIIDKVDKTNGNKKDCGNGALYIDIVTYFKLLREAAGKDAAKIEQDAIENLKTSKKLRDKYKRALEDNGLLNFIKDTGKKLPRVVIEQIICASIKYATNQL